MYVLNVRGYLSSLYFKNIVLVYSVCPSTGEEEILCGLFMRLVVLGGAVVF